MPTKLHPRSIPYVFLGYMPSTKGYRCLDPTTGKVYVCRHVFQEYSFPFSTFSSVSKPSSKQLHTFFWPLSSLGPVLASPAMFEPIPEPFAYVS